MDAAAVALGFPAGPLALADDMGLDVLFAAHAQLQRSVSGLLSGADAAAMPEMVAGGALGRKSGAGFYVYTLPPQPVLHVGRVRVQLPQRTGKRGNPEVMAVVRKYRYARTHSTPCSSRRACSHCHRHRQLRQQFNMPQALMQERLVLRFANEAVRALQLGILASPADGDVGTVLSGSFPRHVGGPFRYVQRRGAASVVEEMLRLQDMAGKRFSPCELLMDMARKGRAFYSWR